MLDNFACHETNLHNGLIVSTQRVMRRRQEQAYQTTISQGAGCLPLVLYYTQSEDEAMLIHEQACRDWQGWKEEDIRFFFTTTPTTNTSS